MIFSPQRDRMIWWWYVWSIMGDHYGSSIHQPPRAVRRTRERNASPDVERSETAERSPFHGLLLKPVEFSKTDVPGPKSVRMHSYAASQDRHSDMIPTPKRGQKCHFFAFLALFGFPVQDMYFPYLFSCLAILRILTQSPPGSHSGFRPKYHSRGHFFVFFVFFDSWTSAGQHFLIFSLFEVFYNLVFDVMYVQGPPIRYPIFMPQTGFYNFSRKMTKVSKMTKMMKMTIFDKMWFWWFWGFWMGSRICLLEWSQRCNTQMVQGPKVAKCQKCRFLLFLLFLLFLTLFEGFEGVWRIWVRGRVTGAWFKTPLRSQGIMKKIKPL